MAASLLLSGEQIHHYRQYINLFIVPISISTTVILIAFNMHCLLRPKIILSLCAAEHKDYLRNNNTLLAMSFKNNLHEVTEHSNIIQHIIPQQIDQNGSYNILCMLEQAFVIAKVQIAIVIRKAKRNARQIRSCWYSLKEFQFGDKQARPQPACDRGAGSTLLLKTGRRAHVASNTSIFSARYDTSESRCKAKRN